MEMSPRANPEGQFLRDALLELSAVVSTVDRAMELVDEQDVEVLLRWRDTPEARRLRETAAEIAGKAERISQRV